MNLLKSQHYTHLSLRDFEGSYSPKPILIVGGSSSGKSVLVEKMVETIEDNIKDSISFFFVDVDDVIEAGFAMFPATDKYQLRQLEWQKEKPEARKSIKLHIIYGRGLKHWQKREKALPEANIITFSAKRILQRDECMFLLEIEKETKSLRLLMEAGSRLKENEDLRFLKKYSKELTEKKKTMFMGKLIDSDEEPIGDKSDLRDVEGVLNIFNYDGCIMPNSFKCNFDARKLLSEPSVRHVFVYKCLKEDEKLKDFFFFHILSEVSRSLKDCKYPVNYILEETQSKAPYRGQGYKATMANKIGDYTGTLRKTARGVSIFLVGRVWNGIAEQVRSECKKQIIFHLEQDDMLKFVKVRNLGKKEKLNIENLATGQCVVRGYESRICMSKVPRHGHKHVYMDFMTEYKKHFPQKLRDYSVVADEVEMQHSILEKTYNEYLQIDLSKRKDDIRKELMRKARAESDKDQFKGLQQQVKVQKKMDKEKRNQEIISTFNELKTKGEKVSYRIVAGLLQAKGIKVSYVTVKNVLESVHSTEGDSA